MIPLGRADSLMISPSFVQIRSMSRVLATLRKSDEGIVRQVERCDRDACSEFVGGTEGRRDGGRERETE
jgi:hypothetical protein